MDWISKEFLLALCGSLLIALIAIVVTVPLVQRPQPQPTESAQRANKHDQKSRSFDYAELRSYLEVTAGYCTSERPNAASEWRKKFLCESKITDVVIAILTFFLAVFTFLLVWVGRKQEQTTRRQMRAFVYLTEGSIINVASPINPLPGYQPTGAQLISRDEGPLVRLIIRNTGSTPAFKVMHWANIHYAGFPLAGQLPPRLRADQMPTSSIPPGGINLKTVKIDAPLTAQQIASLRDGTGAIWIYGEIEYVDAFRRKRTSNYRLFHNSIVGAIGVTTDLNWAEGGNDAN